MTMQSIIGGLTIPHHVEAVIGAPNDLTGYLIDAAAEKVAFIFKIPKSGTITEIGFRTGAVTIADTLKIGLYTVDTSNNPTTTAYGGMVAGTQATPAANTWYNVALGTNCTATADDAAAVVIEFNSYVAGNLRIAALDGSSGSSGNICGFPESKQYTASWANIAARPVFSIKYSDGSYGFIYGCYPVSAVTETAFNSSSTPDERGLKFSIPFPARLSGFWLNYRVTGVTGSADVVLYDSDGTTVLQTHTIDFQKVNAGPRMFYFQFATAQALSKDTFYRLVVKPTTTTSNSFYDFTVNAVAIMDCFEGGQNFHLTTRTDAWAWTDTTTKRPWMGLVLDQFDDGVGGGGGGLLLHNGMTGGING
ncbi:MAG: hypothetical protein A2X99_10250 [Deltaproteobacteria bacterium GWB2_55_19]|nr:MAG: hypothetical protein A2X99_10250 [Deltaproteobacteria bacterium GWB2_55_19]HAO93412.1 hypothetical protein [Deltaproteobacteria bacterium]